MINLQGEGRRGREEREGGETFLKPHYKYSTKAWHNGSMYPG